MNRFVCSHGKRIDERCIECDIKNNEYLLRHYEQQIRRVTEELRRLRQEREHAA